MMTRAGQIISRRARTCAQVVILLVVCVWFTSDTRLIPGDGDPPQYLHAASTLIEGRGLRNGTFEDAGAQRIIGPPDAPMTIFAPLYPVILASLGGGLRAAQVINAVGLWATLILSYALLRRYDAPVGVSVGVCLAFVIMLEDRQATFHTALSESLFLPLWMAWLYTLTTRPYAASVFIGLAALTRYSALPWLVIHAVYMIYRYGLWKGLLCAMIGMSGPLVWLTRNMMITGTLTGHTISGDYTHATTLHLMEQLSHWAMLVTACAGPAYIVSRVSRLWRDGLRG